MIFGSPPIVTSGLVLNLDAANTKSYPRSGTVWRDLSGNNNSGSLVNGPTYNSQNGGSIVFDGVDDYVEGPIINLQSQITVLVFVRPIQRTGTNYPVYIAKWNAVPDSNRSWLIGSDTPGNKETIIVGLDGSYQSNTIKRYEISNINYNTWKQIGFTFNNGSLIPYINGTQTPFSASLNANINTIHTSSISCKLGASIDGAFDLDLNGNVSIAQIYNRALTPSEVQQNYNALKSRFNLQ